MKRMLLLLLTTCTVLAPTIYAQGDEAAVLTDRLSFELDAFRITNRDGYDIITYRGDRSPYDQSRVGHPDLPMVRFRYLLPPGAKVDRVAVTARASTILPGTYLPIPVGPPDGDGNVEPDGGIYNSTEAYPAELVHIDTQGSMRGFMLVDVLVYPFEYVGASGRLTLHTSLDVTVTTAARSQAERQLIRSRTRLGSRLSAGRQELEWLRREIRNREHLQRFYELTDTRTQRAAADSTPTGAAIPTEFPSVDSPPVEYVVVTTEAMQEEFERLADWKTETGVPATVRTVEWIDDNYLGVDRPDRIRNFLIDAYDLWGTDWVMLGGDLVAVPGRFFWSSHSHGPGQAPRDAYYAGIDGTWNADGDFRIGEVGADIDSSDPYWDLWLGRVPARNSTEARTYVDKLFEYTRGPYATGDGPDDEDFYTRFLGFAGMTLSHYWPSSSNGIYLGWENASTSIAGGFTARLLAEYVWHDDVDGCFDQDMIDALEAATFVEPWNGDSLRIALDEGYGLVFHSEHSFFYQEGGASAGAGSPPCRQALRAINNSTGAREMLTDDEILAMSNGVTNGPGAYSVVISRGSFVNGYDGNSVSEAWLRSPEGGAIAYIGRTRSQDTAASTFTTLFDNLFDEDWLLGQVFLSSLSGLSTNLAYGLLGDPELWVWKGSPEEFDALDLTPSSFSSLGAQSVAITVEADGLAIEGARVCLDQNHESYAVGYTNATGDVTFTDFDPRSTDSVLVTVTYPGFRPRREKIPVSSPSTAFVRYDGHEIAEVAGESNENDVPEAGENLTLDVDVRNTGAATSGDVAVWIAVNEQFSVKRSTYDQDFPTQLVIGGRDATVPYDEFSTVTLPLHQTGIRPEGVPSQMGSDDGIYLWRQLDGAWNLGMTAENPSSRAGRLAPEGTIAVFLLSTPTGFPTIHDVETFGMEGGDAASLLSNGTLKVTFTRDTSGSVDADTVRFHADELDWIEVTTATDTLSSISAGGTDTATFGLSMSPGIPEPYDPSFTLYAESGGTAIGVSEFTAKMFAPRLELLDLGFEELSGDTASIDPLWTQYGGADADSIVLRIASSLPNVTVIDAELNFGSVPAGARRHFEPQRFVTSAEPEDPQLDLSATFFFARGEPGDSIRFEFDDLEFDPPSEPTNLRVWGFDQDTYTVQWEPVNDATGYNVYYALGGGLSIFSIANWRLITGTTSFDFVNSGSRFTFSVSAVDASGNVSDRTASVTAKAIYSPISGWPKRLPLGADTSNPLAADVDNDGDFEVFAASDKIYAWEIDGSPYLATGEVFYDPKTTEPFSTALAAGDLDDDGYLEIVACSRDTAYVFDYEGGVILAENVSPLLAPPVIADIDGDASGHLEVLVTSSLNKKIYAWDKDGKSFYAGQDGVFADLDVNYSYGSLSVVDLDGDGGMDVIHAPGKENQTTDTAVVKAFTADDVSPADGRADVLWTYDTGLRTRVWKPAIGDVDGDEEDEIVFAQGGGLVSTSQVVILSAIANSARVEHQLDTLPEGIGEDTGPAISLANLDSDPNLEILVGTAGADESGDSLSAVLQVIQVYPNAAYFEPCPLWMYKPYIKMWESGIPSPHVHGSAVIGQLDSDDNMEIIVGSDQFAVHFLEWDEADSTCGPDLHQYARAGVRFMLQEGEVRATPQIGDFNDDGRLNLLIQDLGGVVTVLNLGLTTWESIEWAGFGNDLQNTGLYASSSSVAPGDDSTVELGVARLAQNSPNPFNPRTTFSYAIPASDHVRLEVFDVGGRRVATIVNQRQTAGVHAVSWDGTDDAGRTLSSGVFFYRLNVGDFEHVRKLLLLR